jgi:hypothetical protein
MLAGDHKDRDERLNLTIAEDLRDSDNHPLGRERHNSEIYATEGRLDQMLSARLLSEPATTRRFTLGAGPRASGGRPRSR